jgi:hypothetical protein
MSNSESNEKKNASNDEPYSSQTNSIWGSAFVRISLYILLGFILLGVSRYVYLKMTGQYPVQYDEQSIIQNPHLEELEKQNEKRKQTKDSLSKDAGRGE